jgi:hypothetical protein
MLISNFYRRIRALKLASKSYQFFHEPRLPVEELNSDCCLYFLRTPEASKYGLPSRAKLLAFFILIPLMLTPALILAANELNLPLNPQTPNYIRAYQEAQFFKAFYTRHVLVGISLFLIFSREGARFTSIWLTYLNCRPLREFLRGDRTSRIPSFLQLNFARLFKLLFNYCCKWSSFTAKLLGALKPVLKRPWSMKLAFIALNDCFLTLRNLKRRSKWDLPIWLLFVTVPIRQASELFVLLAFTIRSIAIKTWSVTDVLFSNLLSSHGNVLQFDELVYHFILTWAVLLVTVAAYPLLIRIALSDKCTRRVSLPKEYYMIMTLSQTPPKSTLSELQKDFHKLALLECRAKKCSCVGHGPRR